MKWDEDKVYMKIVENDDIQKFVVENFFYKIFLEVVDLVNHCWKSFLVVVELKTMPLRKDF